MCPSLKKEAVGKTDIYIYKYTSKYIFIYFGGRGAGAVMLLIVFIDYFVPVEN